MKQNKNIYCKVIFIIKMKSKDELKEIDIKNRM